MNSSNNSESMGKSRLRPPQTSSKPTSPPENNKTNLSERRFHDPILSSLSASIEKNSQGSLNRPSLTRFSFSPIKQINQSIERRLSLSSVGSSGIRKPQMNPNDSSIHSHESYHFSPLVNRRMTIATSNHIVNEIETKSNGSTTGEVVNESRNKDKHNDISTNVVGEVEVDRSFKSSVSSALTPSLLRTPQVYSLNKTSLSRRTVDVTRSSIPRPGYSTPSLGGNNSNRFSFKPRDQSIDTSLNTSIGYNIKRSKNNLSEDSFQQLNKTSQDLEMKDNSSVFTKSQYMSPIQVSTTEKLEDIIHSGYVPVENPLTYVPTKKISQILDERMNFTDMLRKTLHLKVRAPNTNVKDRIREFNEILIEHKNCLNTILDSKAICKNECIEEEKQWITILKDLDMYIYKQSEEMNQYITEYNNTKKEFEHIENDIEELKKEKSQLEEDNKSNVQLQHEYDITIKDLENKINELNTYNSTLHDAIKGLNKDNEDLSDKIDTQIRSNRELETQKSKEVNELEDTLEANIEQYEHDIESIRQQIQDQEEKLQKNIENYTSDINQYTSYLKENKPKLELLKNNLNDIKKSIDHTNQYHTQLEKDKNILNNQFETSLYSYNQLVLQLQSIHTCNQSIVDDIKNEIANLNKDLDQLNKEKKIYEHKEQEAYNNYIDKHDNYLQSMNSMNIMNEECDKKKDEYNQLNNTLDNIKQEHASLYVNYMKLNDETKAIENKVNLENQLFYTERDTARSQLASLKEQYSKEKNNYITGVPEYKRQIDLYEKSNKNLQEEIAELSQNINEIKDHEENMNKQYIEEINKYKDKIKSLKQNLSGIDKMALYIQNSQSLIQDLEKKAYACENERRKLHNKLQELRGNIRVIARVRPFLENETNGSGQANTPVDCISDTEIEVTSSKAKYTYSFDMVFSFSSTQNDVFDEVSNYIQSALDGYNVCLFAYGQTGSGKTYTMQGMDDPVHRGIIPRSIDKILDEVSRLQVMGWEYQIEFSYIEIYMEKINDLLYMSSHNQNSNGDNKLEIFLDKQNHPYISNLTKINVTSKEQISTIMQIASKYRKIGVTSMNDTSSRSHVIFTLYLHGKNVMKKTAIEGKLNLIDLAGSERVSKSKVEGERLEETKMINKSLSTLSTVFLNINNKSSHINFRDSKLTYLLKDCLSSDGKTLMLVNISPSQDSVNETISSLKFASEANQCKLGPAKRTILRQTDFK